MADLTPRVRRAHARHLRELASPSAGRPKILSIFLDLDPSTFATPEARQSGIRSLISEANSEVEKLEGDEKKSLRESLDLVEEFLSGDQDWATDAGGLAIFCSAEAGLFEVLKLPFSPDQEVVVQQGPFLEPLQSELSGERYAVVLVNRRTFRIYAGRPENLREVTEVSGEVHGQHQAGGWSQGRYERSVEEDVKNHLEQAAEMLLSMLKRRRFDYLAVAAADELWPQFERELNAEVAGRVVGRLSLDVENASPDEISEELARLAAERERENEERLLEDLEQNLGRGEKAARGLDEVLGALVEMKVDTLLLDDSFDARGVACRTCHWIGRDGDTCPVDGGELERDVDLVDRAIQLCLSTSSQIQTIEDSGKLKDLGSIAAILRF